MQNTECRMKNRGGCAARSSFCILNSSIERGAPLKPGRVLADGHQVQVLARGPFNRKENMKGRSLMEMGDYRLLPKGLRRMLVFSETFFFREYGKAKAPKKTRRREGPETSPSLALCK
jgi:hypothetical protein